ncbi:MAG: helix-hairpin-helix domain-containing protein [Bacteroidales bacterium]|nr:helix-hairpin-helix domain-containing protein [Bacteroidales bacterium]
MGRGGRDESKFSTSFVTGVIAMTFLIIGYQTALFMHRAAVTKIAADRDSPDTVYVIKDAASVDLPDSMMMKTVHRSSGHSPRAQAVRNVMPRRKVESFRFNPNTATEEELCRLGFTPKQAQSIINYRDKGGRFRRPEDFAKSYVVSDSIFRRLKPYIDIPLVDLNQADSAAFDALPGIGGWFASKMIEHRKALGGYSYKEQLMDIYRFDQEKFDGLSDLITVSDEHVTPYPLWSLPADSLRLHPYIRNIETARAIVLFRENNPPEKLTVEELAGAFILPEEDASRLSRCRIKK